MQFIYSQSQVFHLTFMTLKSTGFKFFAKVMGGSYLFCCSSRITLTLQATLELWNVSNVLAKPKVLWKTSIRSGKTLVHTIRSNQFSFCNEKILHIVATNSTNLTYKSNILCIYRFRIGIRVHYWWNTTEMGLY